jgi:hypothetical protein
MFFSLGKVLQDLKATEKSRLSRLAFARPPRCGETEGSVGDVAASLTSHELDQADLVADGLREDLSTLSVRLQDVLVEERRKSAT